MIKKTTLFPEFPKNQVKISKSTLPQAFFNALLVMNLGPFETGQPLNFPRSQIRARETLVGSETKKKRVVRPRPYRFRRWNQLSKCATHLYKKCFTPHGFFLVEKVSVLGSPLPSTPSRPSSPSVKRCRESREMPSESLRFFCLGADGSSPPAHFVRHPKISPPP